MFKVVQSTATATWQTLPAAAADGSPETLGVAAISPRPFWGFGTCFNELGMVALQKLAATTRATVLDALFAPAGDLHLQIGRLPVGASDYAVDWYSHDDVRGDYDLAHFNIDRDHQWLLPYIQEGLRRNPQLTLFASPWSPPAWLKYPAVYNYGHLKADPRSQQTYANYLVRFLQAYAQAGVPIAQLHVQNEVVADQKFPSCVWSGPQLATFIGDYLGPAMTAAGLGTALWLGTINSADYAAFAGTVLADDKARGYIRGVGYQWAGKAALQQTVAAYPQLDYLQTENECGDGQNSWAYAEYVFDLMRHYITNGVAGYTYWNAVLETGGESTWGWHQNAMISVDSTTGTVTYNPEFYVMKHVAHAVQAGAHALSLTGPLAGSALGFENPDGSRVAVISNPLAVERRVTVALGGAAQLGRVTGAVAAARTDNGAETGNAARTGSAVTVTLAPHSFTTVVSAG
ncbi:glycoside hydrolase family 30 protein [Lacticaseibacillus suihuaensis]